MQIIPPTFRIPLPRFMLLLDAAALFALRKLFLLQTPSLHYGCELWGMHTPRGEAQTLQSIYDRYLRHICGVKYATPSAMLLEELGLSPLQVVWWPRTLEFWNKIAASPVGSLFHTILLDILDDAFLLEMVLGTFLAP